MVTMNKSVDGYIRKSGQWQDALQKLRMIVLECGLTEEIKWRAPCYTYQDKNVLFIGAFKKVCAISFIKGVLLKDAKKILIQQTENSQTVRIIRFESAQQIVEMESTLKAYILEALDVEKAGSKVKFKTISEHKVPAELTKKFKENPAIKTAFKALTPGRQRAYLMHFSSAKQAKTREARIEKHAQRILNGKGIDDE